MSKLSVIAEHRLDIIRSEGNYEVTQDIKQQLRFLEELDKMEKKRHEEAERELLLRAAKSRFEKLRKKNFDALKFKLLSGPRRMTQKEKN